MRMRRGLPSLAWAPGGGFVMDGKLHLNSELNLHIFELEMFEASAAVQRRLCL